MDASTSLPRQLARTRRFSLGVPRRFTVSPDGERVLFLRTGGGRDPLGRLWVLRDGRERLLADPSTLGDGGGVPEAERVRRERTGDATEGVTAYATDAEARVAVFVLDGTLWTVEVDPADGGTGPRRVPTAGPVVDPRPSPDGRRVAYVSSGGVHVVELAGGDDRPLAVPEGPHVAYGLPEHVAAESMYRTRGHWWAPDGGALLVARVDTSAVEQWYVADPANPDRAPRAIPYPAAGTANADVSLHVLRGDGRRTQVRWDREAYPYVTAAGWDAHGVLIGVQSRDQRTVRVLVADPMTGGTELLHEQRDPAWVELVPGTPLRTASGALVHPGEEGDTRRLLVDGVCRTPTGLQLRSVVGAVGERVLFTASENPTETHVWSYAPGVGCTRLSTEAGVHTAAVGGDTVVLQSDTPDGHRVTVLRCGRPAVEVAGLAEEPVLLPRPAFLSLGERELRAALYLPSWYEPGAGPLPVLLDPYGGPAKEVVVRARTWHTCVSQWFAEQGFAVLVADGRGTPGRGPAWEKTVRGDALTAALEDQVDALRAAAASHPALDPGRVAIRGWSFGGYLAAGAVLRRPDVFHAAVAGAAPADQRIYDTHWKERYLGHPAVDPAAYDRSSLIADAPRLRRPLLLVHGMADDNVAVAHTLRLSAALLAAGRPHSVLPLSGVSHRTGQEKVVESLLLFQRDFLKKSLGC